MSTVADYWGAKYFDQSFNRAEWQAHPLSLERLVSIQDGSMRDAWFARTYLGNKPAKRAMGIGVGRAETEIGLLVNGYVEHYDLYDVSPVGLEHAAANAKAAGLGDRVTCHCVDVSQIELPRDHYDLITFVASLHHMTNLEGLLRSLNAALNEKGLLWAANEYVGPDRFGYPEEHLRIVRAFHASLPERYRKHGDPVLHLPTPADVEKADPSESPCSSQILPTMSRLFPQLDIVDLYGSFAFMLFWGLNHDALYETEEGAELVRTVLALDRALVETGALPGYFVHLVARKATPLQQRVMQAGIFPDGRLYRTLRAMRNRFRK